LIKGFRSIKDSGNAVSLLGNFNAFAGLNNSGKSNLLRALNAFFTGYTDPQATINYVADYHRYDLQRKKKNKAIEISVSFSLPKNFKFQQKLKSTEELLGRNFTITKQWKRDSSFPDYFLNNDENKVELEGRQKIDQFLSLINYRYIPNRVLPIDIIKGEHQALRDVLVRRLGKEAKNVGDTFQKIQSVSSKLIKNLSSRLSKINAVADNVRLATPKNWADMVFAFGYRLGDAKVELEDSFQGSGIQSLLMLETLFLIDKDYFQKFGWRQASIWAIEEPESSLHASMEAQVAEFLNSISSADSSRLQIFSTTHSDLVLQYSDKCFYVDRNGKETVFNGALSTLDIVAKSSQDGVSRYVHPILYHPLETVILVDGKYDRAFIKKALNLLEPKLSAVVACLEEFDEQQTGGEEAVLKYLKENKKVILNRNGKAPIMVILDWESRKKGSFDNFAKGMDDKLLIEKWPDDGMNPKLDKTFRGLERYYSDRIIAAAEQKCPDKIGVKQSGIKTIARDNYEEIKTACFEEVENNGLQENDLQFAKKFLSDLIKLIKQKDA